MRKSRNETDISESQVKALPIMPGIVLIALGLVAVFLVAAFVMCRFGIIKLPEFMSNIFSPNPKETRTENSPWEELLASIGGKRENTDFSLGNADFAMVSLSSVFSKTRPENYFQQFLLTERSNGTERETEISSMYCGDRVRMTVYANGQTEKTIVSDGTSTKITDQTGSVIFSVQELNASGFYPESEVRLPSPDKLKERLVRYEAGDNKISVMYDSVNCIFRISVTDNGTGVCEEYDVKADIGVILACRLFLIGDEKPYYEMTTTALFTSVEYTDEQFTVE